jgi:hypothetical protein
MIFLPFSSPSAAMPLRFRKWRWGNIFASSCLNRGGWPWRYSGFAAGASSTIITPFISFQWPGNVQR